MTRIRFSISVLLSLLAALAFTSCLKENFVDQGKIDDERIREFLASSGIQAEKSVTGLYFRPLSQGNGKPATVESVLDITYDMRRLDGAVVETAQRYFFKPAIGSFMFGLTEGVMRMKEGDNFELIVPSQLAFGGNSGFINNVQIAPNTIFILNVALNAVRTDEEHQAFEDQRLRAYIDEQGWQIASRSESGVFRVVVQEGPAVAVPAINATVVVEYKGRLLNGRQFDASSEARFILSPNNLIPGFVDGLRMMNREEKAYILIPSHLAYGARGSSTGNIPPFSPLVFEITLKNFL